jgi:hypothetical protein
MKPPFPSEQHFPTKEEIFEKYINLINETETRSEVSSWAEYWIKNDFRAPHDSKYWGAIVFLSGVDLISTDRPYLHSDYDFLCNFYKIYKDQNIEINRNIQFCKMIVKAIDKAKNLNIIKSFIVRIENNKINILIN